jgi:hypothetical protein
MKDVCDTYSPKPSSCYDQRYITWLMNEYPFYPKTTWRYIDVTGKLIIP